MRLGLMAVPVAFFALFFAYPVVAIVGRGLKAGETGSSAGSARC